MLLLPKNWLEPSWPVSNKLSFRDIAGVSGFRIQSGANNLIAFLFFLITITMFSHPLLSCSMKKDMSQKRKILSSSIKVVLSMFENYVFYFRYRHQTSKGQINSEWISWNHRFSKIATEKFEGFLPQPLKKGQIKKKVLIFLFLFISWNM